MQQLPLGVQLRERAQFASFLPGPNAAVAEQLEQLAAVLPRRAAHWIAGPAGSGKTHLLQAACARASGEQRVAYLPCKLLAPLGPEALFGYESARLLCIDDVEQLSGQRECELALFNLHREADERGAVLVFASRSAPAQAGFTLPDLLSRVLASQWHELRALDEDQQLEVLQRRAASRGLSLDEAPARYLQRRWPRDLDSLCDFLDTLDALAMREQRRLTVPFIREVLLMKTGREV